MLNSVDFSVYRKQSKKGIFVIYFQILYKIFKIFWALLFIFVQRISKIPETTLLYIYVGVFLLFLFFLIIAYLSFKNFQFKIDKHHFVLKKGILKKTTTSIPFDRIQNINFKQNIIQQLINVHEVIIETAGSSVAEISIKALSFSEASALKDNISSFNNDVSENLEKLDDKPFVKIGFSALFKVALTENHLQSLLLFVAILLGFYQQISDVIEGFGKQLALDTYILENTSQLQTNIIFIITSIVLLCIVGILSSITRVFLNHYKLTVFLKNFSLEIYQGLFTKKALVLKKDKVQHITISDNFIKRKLGISYITFNQAISGNSSKKQQKTIKIVGCKNQEIHTVKTLLYPNENLDSFKKSEVNSYYKVRLYSRGIIFLLILNTLLYIGFDSEYPFLINLFFIPLLPIAISFIYKKRRYLFSEELLLIKAGVVETHQTYLPFFKVQNIQLKQNYFQARRNIADIVFQTASGKIKIPCIDLYKARKIYNYTLFKIANSNKTWM